MAQINSSFTAVGSSSQMYVRHGEYFNYAISGTFSATVAIERSQNGGISWAPIASKTAAASGTVLVENPTREPSLIRASCLDFASGTAVVYINDQKNEVFKSLIDNRGKSVLDVVEGGVAITASAGQLTRFMNFKPGTLTSGTSTTPSATTLYLAQIQIPYKCTLTGIALNNGATVGTDKYIAALFDSEGIALANSALAGALTSGADGFQSLAFTATLDVNGPAVYWVGLYVNGTTDRFRSIPALGAYAGLAGSVTGQTFGTVANVTLPTTFTADKGPVAFVY